MTLIAALLPALLASSTPATELAPTMTHSAPPEGAQTVQTPAPEDGGGQKCEMKEAKLVLLVPEVQRPSSTQFRPNEAKLCLFYLGTR